MARFTSLPLAPIIGQVVGGFAYTGRSWVRSRGAEWTNVQVFRSSGRYTPSEDLIYCIVECFGAGGGGGWCLRNQGVAGHAAASGGGSGGYSRKTLPFELVAQGVDVVVGAGGLVGVGQRGGTLTAAATSFGALCIAYGGWDAYAFDGTGVLGVFGAPGLGASFGVGDVIEPGALGEMWGMVTVELAAPTVCAVGGFGATLLGGNQIPPASTWIGGSGNGANGLPNTGAGGGGGQSNSDGINTTRFGGAGGSGLVIVTDVCGTEGNGGGGPSPEPPGTGRPPGVPINANVRLQFVPDALPPGKPCP